MKKIKPKNISRSAQQIAWVKAAQKGDRQAAVLAIQDVDGLIWKLARKWAHGAARGQHVDEETVADIHAEAQLLLFEKAIPSYDPKKGNWTTHASWQIRNACSRWVANHSNTVRIPVNLREYRATVLHAAKVLYQQLHRQPTEEELCAATKFSAKKIQQVLGAPWRGLSLSTPVGAEDDGFTLSDLIADETASPEETAVHQSDTASIKKRIDAALDKLPLRSAKVIRLRLAGLTLTKIAAILPKSAWTKRPLTRERVRQIEYNAHNELRYYLEHPHAKRPMPKRQRGPSKASIFPASPSPPQAPAPWPAPVQLDREAQAVRRHVRQAVQAPQASSPWVSSPQV